MIAAAAVEGLDSLDGPVFEAAADAPIATCPAGARTRHGRAPWAAKERSMQLGICVPHYGRPIEVDRMLATLDRPVDPEPPALTATAVPHARLLAMGPPGRSINAI